MNVTEELVANDKRVDGHFEYDDKGVRCWWDAEIEGWVAETEEEYVSDRMRVIIEAHPEFDGWLDVCDCGCGLPEHCCEENGELYE